MNHHDEFNSLEFVRMIHSQQKVLRRIIHAETLIVICLLLGLVYVSQKPPVIVRIDKLGQTDRVENYVTETQSISELDVKQFTKRFLEDYIALKSNIVVRQFETTLNMMVDELAKQHLKAMKDENTINIVQAAGIRNDLELKQFHLEEYDQQFFVKAKARLETRPLDDAQSLPKTKDLLIHLYLKKVPRSPDQPFGLLAESIQVSLDPKSEQPKENINEVISNDPAP
jgi:hypothetical protein